MCHERPTVGSTQILTGHPLWQIPPHRSGRILTQPGTTGAPIGTSRSIVGAHSYGGAVWRTASHALFFTDADLSASDENWVPRPPLSAHDEDENVVPAVRSPEELLDYLDYCLHKVDSVFTVLTDERAETLVAASHRHQGTRLGQMLVVGLTHLQLHTAQLRAYLVTRGVPWVGE